jgi:hypothetical protein
MGNSRTKRVASIDTLQKKSLSALAGLHMLHADEDAFDTMVTPLPNYMDFSIQSEDKYCFLRMSHHVVILP